MIDPPWQNADRGREYKSGQPAAPKGTHMSRQVAVVLYVVAMVAVIVGVDLVFFRNRFWERLIANIGIVLVFIAFYLRFLRLS
jgi:preprotein translocase subunit SecE